MGARRRRAAAFLTLWLLTLAGVLGLVALANWLIDPYGYADLRWAGVNAIKPRPDTDLVPIKRAALERAQPTALLLGNSRSDIGFDPEHPGWGGRSLSAFNLGLPGHDITSELASLEWSLKRTELRTVVVGLDFMDFLGVPDWPAGPPAVHDEPAVSLRQRVNALLSLTAVWDSLLTVKAQSDPNAAVITRRGFNPLKDYVPIARRDGYYVLFRQRLQESARGMVREEGTDRFSFDRPHASANEALRRIVELCKARGIELHLVIYPYHAYMQLLFDEARLWDAFERWKRVLTFEVASAGAGARAPVVLWDFSGFHAFAQERVPARNDHSTELEYYWEAGHFKQALGNRVLERIFSGVSDPAGEFGVILLPASVDQRIARSREDLQRYRATHPEAVAELRAIVAGQCAALGAKAQPARCAARASELPAPGAAVPGKERSSS